MFFLQTSLLHPRAFRLTDSEARIYFSNYNCFLTPLPRPGIELTAELHLLKGPTKDALPTQLHGRGKDTQSFKNRRLCCKVLKWNLNSQMIFFSFEPSPLEPHRLKKEEHFEKCKSRRKTWCQNRLFWIHHVLKRKSSLLIWMKLFDAQNFCTMESRIFSRRLLCCTLPSSWMWSLLSLLLSSSLLSSCHSCCSHLHHCCRRQLCSSRCLLVVVVAVVDFKTCMSPNFWTNPASGRKIIPS